jgi:hypothetical protein
MSDEKQAKVDNSRLLMSDALKGIVPEEFETNDQVEAMASNTILCILHDTFGQPIVGAIQDVGFQAEKFSVDIEVKTTLEDGMKLIQTAPWCIDRHDVKFEKIEFHVGEDVTTLDSNDGFHLVGVRVGLVDVKRRMCTVLLSLVSREPKSMKLED